VKRRSTPPQTDATFEGRPLDRPDEDLEDQELAFDLGILLSRRRVLGVFGAGAGVALLAACAPNAQSTDGTTSASATPSASAPPSPSATAELDEMPGETAGP
jgi:hypothetical protein